MTQRDDCKACEGRGWVRKGGQLKECPRCVGQVRVQDLPAELRKS